MSEAGREAAKSAAELCRAGERERESTLGAGRKWEARPGGLFGAPSATRSAEEAELVERSFQSLRKVRRRCGRREKPWTLRAVRKGAVQSAPGLREGRDATPPVPPPVPSWS